MHYVLFFRSFFLYYSNKRTNHSSFMCMRWLVKTTARTRLFFFCVCVCECEVSRRSLLIYMKLIIFLLFSDISIKNRNSFPSKSHIFNVRGENLLHMHTNSFTHQNKGRTIFPKIFLFLDHFV